ncbi:MAG: polysaccharide biosynthesis C-terminal domain-containing protein [Nitrococcus sp.]|nr:polysaccharide biosynthesis C-terminal domain-containing protein [Nitrococcus sp.]
MLIKIASTLLALVLAIVLARTLGPEGYGIYAYIFAIVSVVAIPAQLGLPHLVVRETAKAQSTENWGAMKGIWRWASAITGVFSLTLMTIGGLFIWLFADMLSSIQATTLAWGFLLVPLIALGNLRGAALRGLRHVVQGQLPEHVLRPGLFIVFLLLLALALPQRDVTAAEAMELHACAAAVAFLIGGLLLYRHRPKGAAAAIRPTYDGSVWIRSALPLALIGGLSLINKHMDILMLGMFNDSADVGRYRVAVQGGMLVAFGMQAVSLAVAPHFARLHSKGDSSRLQNLVTMSGRGIVFLTLPVATVLIIFGKEILAIVFGTPFAAASVPLAILAVGQLINAATGPAATLLNMTGNERHVARGVGGAAALNVILNLLLIPPFGINGAAVATAGSFILMQILLRRHTQLSLGIEPLPFFRARL